MATTLNPSSEGAMVCKPLLGYIAKTAALLRQEGLTVTVNAVYRWILGSYSRHFDRRFDRRFHIETTGNHGLDELTIDSRNTDFGDLPIVYVPTALRSLRRSFAHLVQDLSDSTFVDFGSGKGRVLFFASRYNFRHIVGVEFARELHEQAQRNIATFQPLGAWRGTVESILIDAVEFPIPAGKCVFFLGNPFEPYVLKPVLENIRQSFEQNPRSMYLIYHYPTDASLVLVNQTGIFLTVAHGHQMAGLCPMSAYKVYRTEPGSSWQQIVPDGLSDDSSSGAHKW
jgi:SAM-dependent methyltransferase